MITFDLWKDFHVGVCQYLHPALHFSKSPSFFYRISGTQLVLSLGYWCQSTIWYTYDTLLRPQNAFSVSGSIFSCLLFFIWMGLLFFSYFLDFMKKGVLSFYPYVKFCILIKAYGTTKIMKFVKNITTHCLSVCKESTVKL